LRHYLRDSILFHYHLDADTAGGYGHFVLGTHVCTHPGRQFGYHVDGLTAAMMVTTNGSDSLQVALVHVFFNVTGILIFYPIPYMRNIPLSAARRTHHARVARFPVF